MFKEDARAEIEPETAEIYIYQIHNMRETWGWEIILSLKLLHDWANGANTNKLDWLTCADTNKFDLVFLIRACDVTQDVTCIRSCDLNVICNDTKLEVTNCVKYEENPIY